MAEQQPDLDEFLGQKPQPAWRRALKWGVIALVFLALLMLLIRYFSGPGEVQYATVAAEEGRLVTTVSATGKLAPTNQVTVGSQLSGLVVKVLADVNDRVVAGQALAEIDPEQIEDQIRQSKAQLAANQAQVEQARATLAEAQAQLARLEEVHRLSNGRVPSATELQAGRADVQRGNAALKVAQANVLASQASLSQNQTQRSRAVIRSPVSGVVLARQVDPGQTVAASFNTPTLFVIAEDLSRMKLEVAIDVPMSAPSGKGRAPPSRSMPSPAAPSPQRSRGWRSAPTSRPSRLPRRQPAPPPPPGRWCPMRPT